MVSLAVKYPFFTTPLSHFFRDMDIVLVLLVHLPVDDPGGHEVDRGKRGAVHGP